MRARPLLIDSNIFLRTIIKEPNESYQESIELLDLIKTNRVEAYLHDLVLAELVWVLQGYYQSSKSDIVRISQAIVNLGGLRETSGFNRPRALALYGKKNVKFVDACLATVKEVAGRRWVVASYDKDFAKLPVKWMKPRQILREVSK